MTERGWRRGLGFVAGRWGVWCGRVRCGRMRVVGRHEELPGYRAAFTDGTLS